jgi:hypothetical protein
VAQFRAPAPNDPVLLRVINDEDVKSVILCVSHPNTVPRCYNGEIISLSNYPEHDLYKECDVRIPTGSE